MIFESHESHRLRGVMVVLIYTGIHSRVATDLYFPDTRPLLSLQQF